MVAKPHNDSPLASLLPDDMVAGGLADDFDGIVREARYAPFDYMGSVQDAVLSIQLKIERLDVDKDADADERFISQNWSAGSLEHFRPSVDGVNPTPGEGMAIEPGYFAMRVGQKTALNNNTNAAQLMRSMLDAQFPRDKFKPDVRFIEGMKGHWNRLPPDKKGGQFKDQTAEQAAKASKRDVLCLTRFDGFVAEGAGSGVANPGTPTQAPAAAASTATTGASSSTAGGNVDEKLRAIVTSVVKAGAPAIKKTALSGAVLKAGKGDKDVNAMVKRVTTTEFLESLTDLNILFDAAAGTVEMIEVGE